MTEIAPKLDEGLKKILQTDLKCVATGYNDGKRMIERKWKVCSHFLPWFLVAENTYWTMNRDG